jgi:hypothetical protein
MLRTGDQKLNDNVTEGYKRHIHISFLNQNSSGPHLAYRINKKYQTDMQCIDIDMSDSLEVLSSHLTNLQSVDNHTRLYINGHGSFKHPDYIMDDNGVKLHYKVLAALLAKQLTHPDLKNRECQPRLKISLVMCESAPFGERLHYELSKYGIYCDIVARNRVTSISTAKHNRGTKKTLPHNLDKDKYAEICENMRSNNRSNRLWGIQQSNKLGLHHQPGSKVVYSWNEDNRQIVKDAYAGRFKKILLKLIDKYLNNISGQHTIASLIERIESLQSDTDIRSLLNEIDKYYKCDSDHDEFILNIQRLIYDYDLASAQLLYASEDNIRIVQKQYCHLYRIFQNDSEYSNNDDLERKLIDDILSCKDLEEYSEIFADGLHRLLDEISDCDSMLDKLEVLNHALSASKSYNIQKYQMNNTRYFRFSHLFEDAIISEDKCVTQIYQKLSEIYVTYSNQLSRISIKNGNTPT